MKDKVHFTITMVFVRPITTIVESITDQYITDAVRFIEAAKPISTVRCTCIQLRL